MLHNKVLHQTPVPEHYACRPSDNSMQNNLLAVPPDAAYISCSTSINDRKYLSYRTERQSLIHKTFPLYVHHDFLCHWYKPSSPPLQNRPYPVHKKHFQIPISTFYQCPFAYSLIPQRDYDSVSLQKHLWYKATSLRLNVLSHLPKASISNSPYPQTYPLS